MYTWDNNFKSLYGCKSLTYDATILDLCVSMLDTIQSLTALCFYCSTVSPFPINDHADLNQVCPVFSSLYADVILFDKTIGALFDTIYKNYPAPTSPLQPVYFPLDGMPQIVDCTAPAWEILKNLNQGIAYYITNKAIEVGIRFSDLFGLQTCTPLSPDPPSVPAMIQSQQRRPKKYVPVAFIVCAVIGSLFIVIAAIYTYRNNRDNRGHYSLISPTLSSLSNDTYHRYRPLIKGLYFLFTTPLGLSIILFGVLMGITIPLSLLKHHPSPPPNANYQRYKVWEKSGLKKMIPDGQKDDFILSSSQVDSFAGVDPTEGSQYYIVKDNENLITVENDQLFIRVGTTQTTFQSRPAVRMAYKEWIQYGVVVVDVEHVPTGPGVWPAFWLNGQPDKDDAWASHGEIDIFEGITNKALQSTSNQTTLHTQKYKSEDGADCVQTINEKQVSCSSGDATELKCGCSPARMTDVLPSSRWIPIVLASISTRIREACMPVASPRKVA